MSQELQYLSQQVALGRSSRRDFLGRATALGVSAALANTLLASAALEHAQAADQAVRTEGSGGATPMAAAAALAGLGITGTSPTR